MKSKAPQDNKFHQGNGDDPAQTGLLENYDQAKQEWTVIVDENLDGTFKRRPAFEDETKQYQARLGALEDTATELRSQVPMAPKVEAASDQPAE
jgi:hypothetical protein